MTRRHPTVDEPPHRVLIVGGGFGGLYAARALRRAPVEVTLVDRPNHRRDRPQPRRRHRLRGALRQRDRAGLLARDRAERVIAPAASQGSLRTRPYNPTVTI